MNAHTNTNVGKEPLSATSSYGGSSSGSSGSGENNEEAAALVLRHFERLKGQWHGVLQDVVYERYVPYKNTNKIKLCSSLLTNYHLLLFRIVGYLLESVLRAAMQPILSSDCVTESAGVDIGRVFRTLKRIRWATSYLKPPSYSHCNSSYFS